MNRIRGFFPQDAGQPEPSAPKPPKQVFTLTLTPVAVAILNNCLHAGAVLAMRVTTDAAEASDMLAKDAYALHSFNGDTWLDLAKMFAGLHEELKQCPDLSEGPPDNEPEHKEPWQE